MYLICSWCCLKSKENENKGVTKGECNRIMDNTNSHFVWLDKWTKHARYKWYYTYGKTILYRHYIDNVWYSLMLHRSLIGISSILPWYIIDICFDILSILWSCFIIAIGILQMVYRYFFDAISVSYRSSIDIWSFNFDKLN